MIKHVTKMATTCKGFYKNGTPCRYGAKYNGFCGIHFSQDCGGGDCPICQDNMTGKKVLCLPCKHRFCRDCMEEWLSRKDTCPMCRATVPRGMYSLHKLRAPPALPPLVELVGDWPGWVLFRDDLVGLADLAGRRDLAELADELAGILQGLGM
jgi:hypothetical protein